MSRMVRAKFVSDSELAEACRVTWADAGYAKRKGKSKSSRSCLKERHIVVRDDSFYALCYAAAVVRCKLGLWDCFKRIKSQTYRTFWSK